MKQKGSYRREIDRVLQIRSRRAAKRPQRVSRLDIRVSWGFIQLGGYDNWSKEWTKCKS